MVASCLNNHPKCGVPVDPGGGHSFLLRLQYLTFLAVRKFSLVSTPDCLQAQICSVQGRQIYGGSCWVFYVSVELRGS